MLTFELIILVTFSVTLAIILFNVVKSIKHNSTPKLIPVKARKYSVEISAETEQDSCGVSKLIEWARRPSQCTYHLGYLERIPRTQSIPKNCLNCYKISKCLGSWKTGNARANVPYL